MAHLVYTHFIVPVDSNLCKAKSIQAATPPRCIMGCDTCQAISRSPRPVTYWKRQLFLSKADAYVSCPWEKNKMKGAMRKTERDGEAVCTGLPSAWSWGAVPNAQMWLKYSARDFQGN